MHKGSGRIPKGYDGTKPTSRKIGELLPYFLDKVGAVYQDRPDLVIAAWSDVIGPKLSSMAVPVSFIEGVLNVKVANSTLHSLLSRYERPRLIKELRDRFPNILIKDIKFRIG